MEVAHYDPTIPTVVESEVVRFHSIITVMHKVGRIGAQPTVVTSSPNLIMTNVEVSMAYLPLD